MLLEFFLIMNRTLRLAKFSPTDTFVSEAHDKWRGDAFSLSPAPSLSLFPAPAPSLSPTLSLSLRSPLLQ